MLVMKPNFKRSQRLILDAHWVYDATGRLLGIVLYMDAQELKVYFGPAITELVSKRENALYIVDNGALLPLRAARAMFLGPYPDYDVFTCRRCDFFGQFIDGKCPTCLIPAMEMIK